MNISNLINAPSPIAFPQASPTPKLFSKPSKKIPETQSWQEMESIPQIDYTKREKYYGNIFIQKNESLISCISPSPALQKQLVIGSPYIKEPIHDPILERQTTINNGQINSKFASFMSKLKKVASGKPNFT